MSRLLGGRDDVGHEQRNRFAWSCRMGRRSKPNELRFAASLLVVN